MRDKHAGLHRVEVKLPADVLARVDEICEELGLSRSEVMDAALKQWLHL